MTSVRILFCGDPHGEFRHIIMAAGHTRASVVLLLGDMEPERSLHEELEPLLKQGVPVYWIPGNHDADADDVWARVWESEIADANLHGRVVELADGTRVAGLGGVFRDAVWYPSLSASRCGEPAFRTRAEHARSTPRQDRWGGTGTHRRHWGTIYPSEVDCLADLQADILVTHEAGGYHPNGFDILDDLARAMGVKVSVHGHQHDAIDSSASWAAQGFQSFGVGLRGLSMLDTKDWTWSIVRPGELDQARMVRGL